MHLSLSAGACHAFLICVVWSSFASPLALAWLAWPRKGFCPCCRPVQVVNIAAEMARSFIDYVHQYIHVQLYCVVMKLKVTRGKECLVFQGAKWKSIIRKVSHSDAPTLALTKRSLQRGSLPWCHYLSTEKRSLQRGGLPQCHYLSTEKKGLSLQRGGLPWCHYPSIEKKVSIKGWPALMPLP